MSQLLISSSTVLIVEMPTKSKTRHYCTALSCRLTRWQYDIIPCEVCFTTLILDVDAAGHKRFLGALEFAAQVVGVHQHVAAQIETESIR